MARSRSRPQVFSNTDARCYGVIGLHCIRDGFNGDRDKKKGCTIFTMSPTMINITPKARNVELPFGPLLIQLLSQAGVIADAFNSTRVHFESMGNMDYLHSTWCK